MTNSPSAGGAAERSPNTSQSHTRSNAQDVKQSTNTFKSGLNKLIDNPHFTLAQNCFIGRVLVEVSSEEEELLKIALADKRIRTVDLMKLLTGEGYKCSEATIRRHRSGGCRCKK